MTLPTLGPLGPLELRHSPLSRLAAINAPTILMSQNRQDARDRVRGELDYDVDRRAATETQGLVS